jgi:PAS domain S-box-containing protein
VQKPEAPLQRSTEMERAACRSMASHSGAGLVFHPIAILFLGSTSSLARTHSVLFAALLVTVSALSAARGFLIRRFDTLYDRAPERWRKGFFGSLLASGVFIGGLIAFAIREGGMSGVGSFAALAVGTAAASIAIAYSLAPAFTRAFVLILCCSPLVAMVQAPPGTLDVRIALGIVAYVLYLLLVTKHQHAERWAGLASTHLLALRAAELERARNDLHRAHAELERLVAERTAELSRLSGDYRQIFDNAHDAIIIFEPAEERVLNVNRRACEIYGFSREEFLGMSLMGLSLAPERGRRQIAETLKKGVYHNFETRQVRKDGSEMHLEINASAIDYEGRPAILSVNRDVTMRRRAEEMTLAMEAAERADRAKSQFLANMSHEIRTPMAGILGLADLLLKTDLTGPQRRYSGLIQSSTASLLGVIDDILDFSKVEAGKLTLETVAFHLPSILGETVELLRFRAQSKGISLELAAGGDLPDWCLGDPGRLRQVVINLLGNAIKFTGEGRVELRAESAPGDRVRIAVRDTGLGIPDEIRGQLFTPFSQADSSTSRRFGGSGLGLAISKRIVKLMGGEIGFESAPGAGSTFWFTVALQRTERPEAWTAASEPQSERALPANPLRILIAEDNPVNQLVVLEQLKSLGFEATAVSNGIEALAALEAPGSLDSTRSPGSPEEAPYDLVLMDCQMPELDGYETTRRMRQRSGDRWRVPVIALTAHAMKGDREKCLAAGMNDYIAKPFRVEALRQVLARWLPQSDASGEPGGPDSPVPPADDERRAVSAETLENLRALGRVAGRDVLRELVDTFRSQPHLGALREALAGQDRSSLERRAHSLKGSSGMLGALRLAELCAELERIARDEEDLEACVRRIDAIEDEHGRVVAELLDAVAPAVA